MYEWESIHQEAFCLFIKQPCSTVPFVGDHLIAPNDASDEFTRIHSWSRRLETFFVDARRMLILSLWGNLQNEHMSESAVVDVAYVG